MMYNRLKTMVALITLLTICLSEIKSQDIFSNHKNLFSPPLSYVVMRAPEAPIIDGNINDGVWAKAQWTEYFQDIEGRNLKADPRLKTRMKMLWDNDYVYFAAEMEEPHVWANLTERDEIVFFDNDFEIFIDPSNSTHRYFEIEMNAMNTIFDLFLSKPYRNGGGVIFGWDTPGMKHAVHIDGSLNNSTDIDRGWTVEVAVPLRAITVGNDKHVPADKEIWRVNFSRVEWDVDIVDGKYIKQTDSNNKVKPEHNWVWSPQGVINMHLPERWGYLQFSEKDITSPTPSFEMPYSEYQRRYLWLVYYKQKDYYNTNKRYTNSLKELGIPNTVKIEFEAKTIVNKLSLEATRHQFTVSIKDDKANNIHLNDEGLILK